MCIKCTNFVLSNVSVRSLLRYHIVACISSENVEVFSAVSAKTQMCVYSYHS